MYQICDAIIALHCGAVGLEGLRFFFVLPFRLRATVKATVVTCRVRNTACTATNRLVLFKLTYVTLCKLDD